MNPTPEPGARADRPAKKRLTKTRARLLTAAAAAVSFCLPWVAFRVAPGSLTAPKQQVVVVPAGSRVVIVKPVSGAPNVTVITSKGPRLAPAAASTSGSAAAPAR